MSESGQYTPANQPGKKEEGLEEQGLGVRSDRERERSYLGFWGELDTGYSDVGVAGRQESAEGTQMFRLLSESVYSKNKEG